MGNAGEKLAAWWLADQGLTPLARNVDVDGGEIDLLMADGGQTVAVEVRTVTGEGDPIDAVDIAKRSHVRRLAGKAGVSRVDFLGVALRSWGVEIHWLPG